MKTLRLITIVLVAVMLFSTWGPAYAKSASSPTNAVELGKTKLAKLRVTNKTGGTLYVTLSSKIRSYSFATAQQGKVTFDAGIQPGKYSITMRTSACRGTLHVSRNVKGGTVSLPGVICRH